MEKDQKVALEEDPKIDLFEDDDEFEEFNINEDKVEKKRTRGGGQKEIQGTSSPLYSTIKVARDEELVKQIGRDIYFDLVDHGKVRSFTIKKQTPFNLFKGLDALEFGILMQFQRFWI